MGRLSYNTIVGLALVALSVVLMPSGVKAITFSPERIDTEVYPGALQTDELTLLNETGELLSVLLEPVELDLSTAESGTASFLLNTAGGASVQWLSVSPEQFVLEPGEQREVLVRMTAPETSSGSLFGGIAVTSRPVRSDEPGAIAVTAVTGPYVFARILSDESLVDGSIDTFEVAGASSFQSSLPIPLGVSFANNGTVHLKPTGTVDVRDMFGRRVDQLVVNADGLTILPGTTRVLPLRWGSAVKEPSSALLREFRRPLLGPFRLTATMHYGDDSVEIAQTTVWLLPWRTALLLGVVLVGIAAARQRLRTVHV